MSRSGNKRFDQCDVKIVEFTRHIRDSSTGHIVEEKDRDPDKDYVLRGYRGSLHCPRTEDDRVSVDSVTRSHPTQLEALNSVRKLTGNLLCSTCKYSTMTPLEISQERAAVARAEVDRLEAFTSRAQALAELALIDPAYRTID